MNRKRLFTVLAIESVLLSLVCALAVGEPDQSVPILSFPFAQIGAGLPHCMISTAWVRA